MKRRTVVMAVGALVGPLMFGGALWAVAPHEPPPLQFLDRYPLEKIYVAEANAPAPNGQPLLCRTYAIVGSVEEVESRLSREAKDRGMPYVLENGDTTWLRLDRTLSVRISHSLPREIREPGPKGTTGYVVAMEPERVTIPDRIWRFWLRFEDRLGRR